MPFSAREEPEVVDITVHIGNSFNRTLELEEDDGTPAKLSAYYAVAQIMDNESNALLAEFVVAELQDDGKIPLTLKRSDTLSLEVGSAVWAVTLVHKTKPDLDTTTIIVGEVQLKKIAYVVPDSGGQAASGG